MKQFIVLAAVLPIMLVLISQCALEAVRSLRMGAAEAAVRAFCAEASYYGGGGPAEAEALRLRLARIFNTDAHEIYIELWQADAAHIDWRISFPVGDIMAGGPFMGLSDTENRGRAQMDGAIVVAPPPHDGNNVEADNDNDNDNDEDEDGDEDGDGDEKGELER